MDANKEVTMHIAKHRQVLRRVLAKISIYYAALAGVIAIVLYMFPGFIDELPLGGVRDIAYYGASQVHELEDAFLSADDEELEDIAARRTNLESEAAELKENREEESRVVDPDVLDIYNRLFDSKGGLVVVGLIDEKCQGCHMKVTKSTVIDVKNEQAVTHCENCGRILYWWTA